MIIRRAKKTDLSNYLELREENLREYYKMTGDKLSMNKSDLVNRIRKEFRDLIKMPRRDLLVLEKENRLIALLIATEIKNAFKRIGYIDDIFVEKEFRRKGIASQLIKDFVKRMNNKKIKKFRLGVDIKNKHAIELYKKLGFNITQYEMEMGK